MSDNRKDEALRRGLLMLEVSPEALAAAPKITHLLKHAPNGEAGVWEILEGYDSVEARNLLLARARLNLEQREAVPFEAIVLCTGLTTKRAFGLITEAIVEHSQDAARMILHAATPEIMLKVVENAKNGGGAEAKMLLQATNLVPRPKNTVVIHNGDVVKGNKAQVTVLPNPEDTGRRLGDRFNTEMKIPLQLAAPEPEEYSDEPDDEADYAD